MLGDMLGVLGLLGVLGDMLGVLFAFAFASARKRGGERKLNRNEIDEVGLTSRVNPDVKNS